MPQTERRPPISANAHAPARPEDNEAWRLALKFAIGSFLAVAIARWGFGYEEPTVAFVSVCFLVVGSPHGSLMTALLRMGGLFVGAALGIAGGYWGESVGVVPIAFFVILAAVTGVLSSYRGGLVYIALIGSFVATRSVTSETGVLEVAEEIGVLLTISCIVGPITVWMVEKSVAALGGTYNDRKAEQEGRSS